MQWKAGVPESVKQEEINVAIEKTKAEQVQKAVEAALKKAGINPSHVDSEDTGFCKDVFQSVNQPYYYCNRDTVAVVIAVFSL